MPLAVLLPVLLAASAPPPAPPSPAASPAPSGSDPDRARIATEIERLGSELARLSASERGVLGEINRLDALARLHTAERDDLSGRADAFSLQVDQASARVTALETRAQASSDLLKRRLRTLYRMGPLRHYRLLADASSPEGLLAASRTAAALVASDAAVVSRAREAAGSLEAGREDLRRQEQSLRAASETADAAARGIEQARAEKARLLASIRQDRLVRTGALEELRRAGSALEGLAGNLPRSATAPAMDFSRFQGLLPWPAPGRVRTAFGPRMHPRFQTIVPHDGLDIDAPYGADVRAVFDGTVAYAGWLSGYGLTTLVDHGGGFVTVYAHASALLVEAGEAVRQGQLLGQVGDTGSIEGALLYFEIRKNGRPVDPRVWLKGR